MRSGKKIHSCNRSSFNIPNTNMAVTYQQLQSSLVRGCGGGVYLVADDMQRTIRSISVMVCTLMGT